MQFDFFNLCPLPLNHVTLLVEIILTCPYHGRWALIVWSSLNYFAETNSIELDKKSVLDRSSTIICPINGFVWFESIWTRRRLENLNPKSIKPNHQLHFNSHIIIFQHNLSNNNDTYGHNICIVYRNFLTLTLGQMWGHVIMKWEFKEL